ncbi:MAG: extracellular solute-binding protein, partial [Gammaproteobacteria bacterium]|nr:extracellular solute-binding protein [Gammaproteobacteria bacterium]
MHRFKTLFSALAVAGGLVATGAQAAQEVNVYSYRQPFLIEPIFDAFTRETGIKVNVVFAKTGLEERLKREGKNSPADLILTVDVGRMDDLVNDGLTQPVSSEKLNTNIPASYRDPEGRWFSLTSRARVLFASRERVPEGTVKTYEELADPKWKGKLCSRSGKHAYNVALIASMIAHHGEADAEKWLKGVKDNLARKPQGGDRDQIKAIKEGVCDLAIGN